MPAHSPLGVILLRLRIAQIHQDTVAHVLRDEPAETAHSLGDALLVGRMTSRRSSGSIRAESAVEPTSPSYSAGLEFELTGVAQGVELA